VKSRLLSDLIVQILILHLSTGGRYGRGGDDNVDLNYRYDVDDAKGYSLVDSSARKPATTGSSRSGGLRVGGGRQPGAAGRPGRNVAQNAGVGGAGTRGYDDRGAIVAGRAANKLLSGPGSGNMHNKRYLRFAHAAKLITARPGSIRRETSVKVENDWVPLETFNLSDLTKLAAVPPSERDIKDLRWAGSLETYDDEYDTKVSAKNPRKLRHFNEKDFAYVSANMDPIMEQLASEDKGNVFASDAVLAHLMASPRSVYPWDIVITYLPGGIIFLDVRVPLEFELEPVNETAHVPPPENDPDDINGRSMLTVEASIVHANFMQQILSCNNGKPSGDPLPDEPELEPSPFFDVETAEPGHEPASMAYRYRSFRLGNDITLVARTTLHAVQRKGGASKFVTAWTLNEWDPKLSGSPEYRKCFDTQRGNLIATEIKNNRNKLAKFTISSLLAGADSMKIGFVARNSRTDSENHQIIGVAPFPPANFATQLALSDKNIWGILKWLIELVRKHARNLQEDVPDEEFAAKFVLLRDANKPAVFLYAVPFNTFDFSDADSTEQDAAWAQE
jgi:translation initiation factor 3 subunit D